MKKMDDSRWQFIEITLDNEKNSINQKIINIFKRTPSGNNQVGNRKFGSRENQDLGK